MCKSRRNRTWASRHATLPPRRAVRATRRQRATERGSSYICASMVSLYRLTVQMNVLVTASSLRGARCCQAAALSLRATRCLWDS